MEGIDVMEHDRLAVREFDAFKSEMREDMQEIRKSMEAMWKKIDGRPSWGVLVTISAQSTIIGMMVMLLLHFLTKT